MHTVRLAVLIALVLMMAAGASAQEGEGSTSYEDPVSQTVLQGPSPGRRAATNLLGDAAVEPDPGSNRFGAGVETMISAGTQAFNIPLSWERGPWAVDLTVPFFINREFETFSGTTSSMGLGDALVNVAYSVDTIEDLYLNPRVGVKLPTGDPEKQDDDGFLTPMGTGSLDLLVGANGWYRVDERSGALFDFYYRLNTSYENVEYGDILYLNGEYMRRVHGRWGGALGLFVMNVGDSDFGGWEAGAMTLVDINPGVTWQRGAVTVRGSLSIPVVSESDLDVDREIALRLGFVYGF